MSQIQILLVAAALAFFSGSVAGWKINTWKHDSERVAAKEAAELTIKATAKELAKLEVKHVTIRQTLEKEIHEKTIYRDCKHTDDGLRVLNSALSESSDPAELSTTDKADK